MSTILDVFGLSQVDFFISDNLSLCGNDRKVFGQIKRDKNGHFHVTVGKDAQDCNGPIKHVRIA
jgi:hypothetical protein